jgi:hypothetical protein
MQQPQGEGYKRQSTATGGQLVHVSNAAHSTNLAEPAVGMPNSELLYRLPSTGRPFHLPWLAIGLSASVYRKGPGTERRDRDIWRLGQA